MSAADWRRRIIPDVYLFPFMLAGMIVVSYFPWVSSAGESAIAAAAGYGLGAGLGRIFEKFAKRRASSVPPIGMGDIKLLAAGGIWLGTNGLAIAVAASCALGIIWGIWKKQKYIPFAPFFFAGSIISLICLLFLI
jgi:leader peptidase (prepilin peptidase)/N-methyltransferase